MADPERRGPDSHPTGLRPVLGRNPDQIRMGARRGGARICRSPRNLCPARGRPFPHPTQGPQPAPGVGRLLVLPLPGHGLLRLGAFSAPCHRRLVRQTRHGAGPALGRLQLPPASLALVPRSLLIRRMDFQSLFWSSLIAMGLANAVFGIWAASEGWGVYAYIGALLSRTACSAQYWWRGPGFRVSLRPHVREARRPAAAMVWPAPPSISSTTPPPRSTCSSSTFLPPEIRTRSWGSTSAASTS